MRAFCTGRRIAEALSLQFVFLCEFEELWSPLRDEQAQVTEHHILSLLLLRARLSCTGLLLSCKRMAIRSTHAWAAAVRAFSSSPAEGIYIFPLPPEVRGRWWCGFTQGGGVHGNAILSRFDITDVRVVEHRCRPHLSTITTAG